MKTEIELIYRTENDSEDAPTLSLSTDESLSDAIYEYWVDRDVDFPTEEQMNKSNWRVINWGEVESYSNLQDLDLLYEISQCDISYDWDVISAAIDCDISPENIDEAYQGEYASDEDFARNIAEELGYTEKHASWPYTHIDWDWAASDLMSDYCKSNYHYFRNF